MSQPPHSKSSNAGEAPLSASNLPNKKKKSSTKKAQTGGLAVGRYLTWIVIVATAGIALAEFRAQYTYHKNLNICQTALEKTEGRTAAEATKITFDEIKESLAPRPEHQAGIIHQFSKCDLYSWSWQGLRRYSLRVFVSPKDGRVLDVDSARTWLWSAAEKDDWDGNSKI